MRPEWVDYNRHISDFRYSQLFGEAMDALFRQVGVDEDYRATRRMYYTVENHVKHTGEAKLGEPLYITAQVLKADDKRLHVFQRLHRGSDDRQIASAEQMYLHVDTTTAKAAPADREVHAKLAAIGREHATLPLPGEVGRSIARPSCPKS